VLKEFIKAMLAKTPYRVLRYSAINRFQAIEDTLRVMRDRGYRPRVIVDGGAHLGLFSVGCASIFEGARMHLVEPQPSCAEALKALCAKRGFEFHPYALADQPGSILMTGTETPSTGAHMVLEPGPNSIEVAKITLDNLLENRLTREDRALLKLDLQGFELYALRGAGVALQSVEVVLTEVSFFAQAYEPSISQLIGFLDQSGFELYDVAALTARQRDNRLHQGDFVFVRKDSPLAADRQWH